MGWAKYAEDNMEIFNSRMYEKGIGWPSIGIGEFKKEITACSYLIPQDEEYILLLKEIKKIQKWLEIIDSSYKLIKTNFVIQTLDKQKDQLIKAKDEYINYKYDPKFKTVKDKQFNISDMDISTYESRIIQSYISYFIDKLKGMENYTNDDAIAINDLYLDIEEFIEKFLPIDRENLEISLIQYLRENILNEDDNTMILCSHCGGKTYRDFNSCIRCKYPREVK